MSLFDSLLEIQKQIASSREIRSSTFKIVASVDISAHVFTLKFQNGISMRVLRIYIK